MAGKETVIGWFLKNSYQLPQRFNIIGPKPRYVVFYKTSKKDSYSEGQQNKKGNCCAFSPFVVIKYKYEKEDE